MDPINMTLYDIDFYAWTQIQAAALQKADFDQLDIANLIEEIEGMGKSERRQLESRLAILMAHLLKWQFQPGKRSRSWQATIRTRRRHLHKLLDQNLSLRPTVPQVIVEAYIDALDLAWAETGLDEEIFPTYVPYTSAQILDDAFLPG
ncbi:DUF29 domain-containing protein [soil metagenome]